MINDIKRVVVQDQTRSVNLTGQRRVPRGVVRSRSEKEPESEPPALNFDPIMPALAVHGEESQRGARVEKQQKLCDPGAGSIWPVRSRPRPCPSSASDITNRSSHGLYQKETPYRFKLLQDIELFQLSLGPFGPFGPFHQGSQTSRRV